MHADLKNYLQCLSSCRPNFKYTTDQQLI